MFVVDSNYCYAKYWPILISVDPNSDQVVRIK